jgi:hypothetical protein
MKTIKYEFRSTNYRLRGMSPSIHRVIFIGTPEIHLNGYCPPEPACRTGRFIEGQDDTNISLIKIKSGDLSPERVIQL